LAIDILILVFVVLLTVLGWMRGLISQVVTIGAAVALWLTAGIWSGPVAAGLGKLGGPFADHDFLARMAGFLLLYGLIVVVVFLIERKIVNKVGPLKLSNHWLGGVLGATKGVVYSVVAVWVLQTFVLWKQPAEEPAPDWMEGSIVVERVGPYNPVRLFSLRELVDAAAERVAEQRAEGEDQANPSGRLQKIEEAPSVRAIIEETIDKNGFSAASYRELAADPRVRAVLADPDIRDMLFGN